MTAAQSLIEQGIEQGMQKGILQGRLDIAKSMLKRGFDSKLIQEVTQLRP